MDKKKRVLLFARNYYASFYNGFESTLIEPIFVTLTHNEKIMLTDRGQKVVACFEDDYDRINYECILDDKYLRTSFSSDRFLNRFNIEKRIEILKKEISFWKEILNSYNPQVIVHETVTLEILEVLEIESRERCIPYYSFLSGFLPYTFYWKDSPYNSLFNSYDVSVTDEEERQAKEYINSIRNEHLKPFYVRGLKKNSFFKNLYEIVFTHLPHYLYYKFQESLRTGFHYELNSPQSKREIIRLFKLLYCRYDSMKSNQNFEYVFYPLHYEPEATLAYFVYPNIDQSFVIETIAKSLKLNQILVVKEHPQQVGALMESKYRIVKKRNSNIKYIPGYIPSDEVIKQSQIIVTLTSTAAWESYICGKNVIVLGDVFFSKFKGITKCNISDLCQVIRNGIYEKFDEKDVIKAVSFMMSKMKEGAPFPYPKVLQSKQLKDFISRIEELFD